VWPQSKVSAPQKSDSLQAVKAFIRQEIFVLTVWGSCTNTGAHGVSEKEGLPKKSGGFQP